MIKEFDDDDDDDEKGHEQVSGCILKYTVDLLLLFFCGQICIRRFLMDGWCDALGTHTS